MKILRTFAVAAVIVAGVLTLGLGYYGFVPGLSAVLGSSKPRDLKIEPTAEDLLSAKAKSGIDFGSLRAGEPPEDSISFSGSVDVKADLTDHELTALLRNDYWRYGIIDRAQVRINRDGTEEIAGFLRLERVYGYARANRVDMAAFRPYLQALESFTHHPAFYLKLKSSWADGRLALEVQRAEIGRYEIPKKAIEAHAAEITAAVEGHILHVPGVVIRTVTFGDGVMHVEGSFPKSIRWSP